MQEHGDFEQQARAAWDAMCAEVRDEMAAFVARFTTPISEVVEHGAGLGWGTGNYVCLGSPGVAHLLTNEHVAARVQSRMLAHLPTPGAEYEAITHDFDVVRRPYDMAVARVDAGRLSTARAVLTVDQFDPRYAPAEGELFFWLGYPGTSGGRFDTPTLQNRRVSLFSELPVRGVPMLVQAFPEWPSDAPEEFDPALHALVPYPERAWERPEEPDVELPSPHGMSGSLLWDTKLVACERAGIYWTPEHARVCGLIWSTTDTPPCVAATKIEHVHAWLAALNRPVSADDCPPPPSAPNARPDQQGGHPLA